MDSNYVEWLTAAYHYYWGVDTESHMSDFDWDAKAKKFAKNKHLYAELKDTDYDGGSLFWLSKNKYPDWAKE